VIHACLGNNIVAVEIQITGTRLLTKDISGKTTSIIDSTHCIKEQFCAHKGMMLTISVKKFLTVLADKLKEV
jgi:hypothetical protein